MVKYLLLLISIVVIATVILVNYQENYYANNAKNSISSYQECVDAGYPVAESYPEQCFVPDGPSFTRTIE